MGWYFYKETSTTYIDLLSVQNENRYRWLHCQFILLKNHSKNFGYDHKCVFYSFWISPSKFSCTWPFKIFVDVSCFIKGWLSFVFLSHNTIFSLYFFVGSWGIIRIKLFHWMLIFLDLTLTMLANVLPHCGYLVAKWNLPSPPFSSFQDGWWDIWRATTLNKGYLAVNFVVGQWPYLILWIPTSLFLVVILI